MPLTDSAIRVLKPREKAYKVADEKGLYLLVTPPGGRLWKLKFRTAVGAEKRTTSPSNRPVGHGPGRHPRDRGRGHRDRTIALSPISVLAGRA
jgi:hypothetical protein